MDATRIAQAAKFCGWHEDIPDVAPDDPAYFSYPNGQGDMYACIADEEGNWHITADGCESMKAELRKRGRMYHITWDGTRHEMHIYHPHKYVTGGDTEAEVILAALAQLEDEK